MAFIVSAAFSPEALADEIATCRRLAGCESFGINLYISRKPGSLDRLHRYITVLRSSGIRYVETAGGDPSSIMLALKEAGFIVIHKAPSLRYALKAQSLGVDAVSLLGAEAGGHPGATMKGSFVLAADASGKLRIPYVVAGGVGRGSQLAAALALGADGVLMGSRMLVSEEVWLHDSYKQRLIDSDGSDNRVVMASIRDNRRILDNDTARMIAKIEAAGATGITDFLPHISGALAREAYRTGNWRTGALDVGQSIVFAEQIAPVEAIFDEFLDEAVAAARRLGSTELLLA
jgi:nitronate monooxygenase